MIDISLRRIRPHLHENGDGEIIIRVCNSDDGGIEHHLQSGHEKGNEMEKLNLRVHSSQAKFVGTIASISGALIKSTFSSKPSGTVVVEECGRYPKAKYPLPRIHAP
ncbi:hypothetical protein FEM48_Zijuj10G0059800 [Ziziphus jujuba var. spinosa]|uniref:Uncharacterized protein n=1 Tax=Ziziphus jujuba var. spinosa TaxID=714518 RepID=A0A978ULQ2_ZIZJJ|nr:hypothetical protein FEM48_Zijuj10G0059800 [Ziziphus jujuba var. spinosa]